ncbi:restriction endonuclease subunit S [Kordia sp.]|uniref:restriction endonuclease subunit S n=1 Tax=Kordia sp. TaxID=1965332 RepID=UPI003D6B8A21
MTQKTYTSYKDSGIEWLGTIPKHWEDSHLKRVCKLIKDGTHASIPRVDKGFPLLSVRNIVNNEFINLEDDSCISKKDYLSITKSFKVEEGDIQLAIVGATMGKVAVVKKLKPFATQRSIATIRVHQKYLNNRYLFYFMRGEKFQNFLWNNTNYSAQPGIYLGTIEMINVFIPPKKEQHQIAHYLDVKTKAIDKKIQLLQQQITQYKAYRKSLINAVVTGKRLVKDNTTIAIKASKTKDSGISWIGKIPKHWEVKRIKDIFNISRGRAIGKTELKSNGKYPVYSSQTKNNGILGYIDSYDFNANLLTWTTDGVNAGTVFIRKGKFNCTNICGTLIVKNNSILSLKYMEYAVQESTKHNKRIDTNGAKIMSNEMSVINTMLPPKKEQQEIANYLDRTTKTIDKIVENLQTQISTLQELRKTLINDVVTGKVSILHTQEAKDAGERYEEDAAMERKLHTLRRL